MSHSRRRSHPSVPPTAPEVPPSAGAALLLGLVVMAAAFGLGLLNARTPAAQPFSAPAQLFSADRAWPLLERLIGDGAPHPVGTAANAAVRDRVASELESLGYEVELQPAFSCHLEPFVCAHVVNMMARLPGQLDGSGVLLTAHYDSVGAGPGVADDMAGVATVLEVARILRDEGPLRNPVLFLFTDGEEAGLLGAEAFTTHPWMKQVGAVVNLEARGTSGRSFLFETSPGNAWLIAAFADAAPTPVTSSLLYEIYRLLPNDTDFSVYRRHGLAGVNFAFIGDVAHYHTPLDDLDHLDRGSFQHQGDNALAAVRALGTIDLSDPPTGDSLFLDLFPGRVLQVPITWGLALAIACLLAWLALSVSLLRRRIMSAAGLTLGFSLTLLGLVLAAGLGLGATAAIGAITGLPAPWHAHPLPARIAVWAAAALGMMTPAALLGRRIGFWGWVAGIWLAWSLLCVVTAWSIPGAAVVLILPTVVATLLLGAVGMTRLSFSRWAPRIAVLATIAITAYLWLPLALTVEAGVGLEMSPALALLVALVVATLTPLLALTRGKAAVGGAALFSAAAVAVVAVGWASIVQPFSVYQPQRLSILHVTEANDGAVHSTNWVVDRWPWAPLPDTMEQVGAFAPAAVIPWIDFEFLSSPAAVAAQPVPTLERVSDEVSQGQRVLTVRLRAASGGDQLMLMLPGNAGVNRVELPGTGFGVTVGPQDAGDSPGYRSFTCHGVACDGTEIALHIASAGALELIVVEQGPGLPAAGAALLAARPSTAVPSQDGDIRVAFNRVRFDAP